MMVRKSNLLFIFTDMKCSDTIEGYGNNLIQPLPSLSPSHLNSVAHAPFSKVLT